MATVSSTIKMFDAMSGPLKSITNGMNLMISTMYKMQDATNRNTNIDKSLNAAKRQIASAEVEINRQINMTKQSQDNFNRSVRNTKSSMSDLSIAVIAVNQGIELVRKGWGLVNQSMGLADEMTATNARLALVNDGLRTQAELQRQVLDVANRTRQGYVETAGLITKLGAGTQGIFKNDDELLSFAERFNKSLVISGATALESSSAILQMSQALGSGLLQGDELRSLSETVPVMMRILSDGLGIARGELKQMGADGELTADKIVKAFQNQSEQIDSMFKDMPMTFGGAMTIMGNYLKTWFGSLNQIGSPLTQITNQVVLLTAYLQSDDGMRFMNGLAQGIGTAVSWLMQLVQMVGQVYNFFSSNWSVIGPIVWGVAAAIIGLTLAIKGAALAQALFNAVMNANPIVLIITIIAALVIALYKLWTTNDKVAAGLYRAWNAVLNFFDTFPAYFWQLVEWLLQPFVWWAEKVGGVYDSVINGIISGINAVLKLINKVTGSSYEIEAKFNMEDIANKISDFAGAKKDAAYASAALKAQEREQKVVDFLDNRASKRAKEQAEKEAKGSGMGTGTTLFSPTGGSTIDSIDKVNKVGKIEDSVDISSEDLKLMRELAEMKSIQNFVSYTPTVQVTTGPVSKEVDINEVVARIEQTLEEDLAANAAGVYE